MAVRAVRKHDKWFFTNWDYPLPEESCSHLSNPEWKPRIVLELRDPMHQVFCELNECTDKMRQTFNREVEQSPKQP